VVELGGPFMKEFDLGGLGGRAGSVTLLSSFGGNLGCFEAANPGIC